MALSSATAHVWAGTQDKTPTESTESKRGLAGPSGVIAYGSNQPPKATKSYVPPLTTREILLSILVLAFGAFITGMEHRLLTKRAHDITQDGILVLHAVTLVVIGTLFLITSGYTERQIAPAMGLFGTIIGYILGRRSPGNKRQGNGANRAVKGAGET